MELNTGTFGIVAKQTRIDIPKNQLELLNESLGLTNSAEENTENKSVVDEILENNKDATVYSIADEIAASETDTKDISNIAKTEIIKTKVSFTLDSSNAGLKSRIKEIIYNIHHPEHKYNPGGGSNPVTPGGNDPVTPGGDNPVTPGGDDPVTPGGDDPDNPGGDDDDDTPTESFLKSEHINDLDSLFNWMHNKDNSITKESGLTMAQLWEFTQNDDWEKDHYYFFGQLNRIFTKLDQNNDEILSYEELERLFGDSIGSYSEYTNDVESYAAQIQSAFSAMNLNQKMDFMIEMTKKYFRASGLTEQTQAIERLIQNNKISYKNLGGNTLGQYVAYYNTSTGEWAGDSQSDAGLFIDKRMAQDPSTQWYELVEVMVHEITHSTVAFHPSERTKSSEYVAYQVGEDYLDSVAAGYWAGPNEKSEIESHIRNNYESWAIALKPDWKWWSYA